jgi:RNA polymerase sigma factor (sigma-70 family)
MIGDQSLAERFETHRPRLQALSYRMLGSLAEAEDAVQEAWVRLSRTDAEEIENLGGWLTTVVGRVCLNQLRSRRTRREDPLPVHIPDPVVCREDEVDPEREALFADSVGLALMVVLETLDPAQRLAFVLHDMFDVPFDEIASIAGRTPTSVRQLASRARRKVQNSDTKPDVDVARQRQVVNAFFAAARDGDFEALVGVLDPDVVIRSEGGSQRPAVNMIITGAENVASRALTYARLSPFVRPALVNGAAGVVVAPRGEPFAVLAFTVRDGKIKSIDSLGDPVRLRRLELSGLAE